MDYLSDRLSRVDITKRGGLLLEWPLGVVKYSSCLCWDWYDEVCGSFGVELSSQLNTSYAVHGTSYSPPFPARSRWCSPPRHDYVGRRMSSKGCKTRLRRHPRLTYDIHFFVIWDIHFQNQKSKQKLDIWTFPWIWRDQWQIDQSSLHLISYERIRVRVKSLS